MSDDARPKLPAEALEYYSDPKNAFTPFHEAALNQRLEAAEDRAAAAEKERDAARATAERWEKERNALFEASETWRGRWLEALAQVERLTRERDGARAEIERLKNLL